MSNTWDDILKNALVDGSIKSKYLSHIPKMKDCENWGKVDFLGRVKCEFKYSKLDGGLIRYQGNLYYINISQIMVLANMYKWNTLKSIRIIEDET